MITSLSSPKIARLRRLLETHSPRDRKEAGSFVVEGLRAVDALLALREPETLEIYCTSEWLSRFPTGIEISEDVAKKISDTVTTQGIFAVVPVNSIPFKEFLTGKQPYFAQRIALFLELQDPGNAGTIIRSAHAFGIDAVIFGNGSVDPFSGKVVRASAGSIAALPIFFGEDGQECIASLRATHQILAFDMEGEDLREVKCETPLLMVFGNEARGLPTSLREDDSVKKARINMAPGIESLNVASAATIAMYEISRRD